MDGLTCPLCTSQDVRLIDWPCFHTVNWIAHVSLEDAVPEEFALHRCNICGLQFKSGIPQEDVFENSYQQSLHGDGVISSDLVEARRFDLFEDLASKHAAGSRVLDYGCGSGEMLYSWSDRWEKYGIELSIAAQQVAKSRGITMVDANFLETAGEQFDVVVLIDLIEHIRNPRNLFAQLLAALKPGGSLIIYTGRTSHWFWRWAKGGYWYCSFPEHVCFFSERTFEYLGKKFGLQMVFDERFSHMESSGRLGYLGQLTKNVLFHLLRLSGLQKRVTRFKRGYPSFTCARDHTLVVLQKK